MDDANSAVLEKELRELRRAGARMAVSQLRLAAQAHGIDKMTLAQINAEIKAAKRRRKKRAPKRLRNTQHASRLR